MDLDYLIKKGYISPIIETELERYNNFFENSYKENLGHSKYNLEKFPRWSIISGYYAMHDITKLFIAKNLRIKINFKVHKIALVILKEISKDKEVLRLLKKAYNEFVLMANDLAEGKKKRTKAQYYTGSSFMKEKYIEESKEFLEKIVIPYLNKINELIK
jgi:hypothetical protein